MKSVFPTDQSTTLHAVNKRAQRLKNKKAGKKRLDQTVPAEDIPFVLFVIKTLSRPDKYSDQLRLKLLNIMSELEIALPTQCQKSKAEIEAETEDIINLMGNAHKRNKLMAFTK